MKKINKGFLFYLLIVLGILIGAFLICVAIMIFSPGVSIFGISYYKENKSQSFQTADMYEFISNKLDESQEEWFKFYKEGYYEFNIETKESELNKYFIVVDNTLNTQYYITCDNPNKIQGIDEINIEGIDNPSSVCKIVEQKLAFLEAGVYKVNISSKNYVFAVNKDLTYKTYTACNSPKNVIKIEEQNNFSIEDKNFKVLSEKDYFVKDKYGVKYYCTAEKINDELKTVYYKLLNETPEIENENSFKIIGEKNVAEICEFSEGALKFFKNGKFKIELKNKNQTQLYYVFVNSDLIPTYYNFVNFDGEIIKIIEGNNLFEANISYYKYKNDVSFESLDVAAIKVNSNLHSVKILKANSNYDNYEYMRVYINNKTSGFITNNLTNVKMEVKYYSDIKVLEINALVPEGFWTIGNTSSIFIQIPQSRNTTMMDLDIKAGKGSVVIGDSQTSGVLPNEMKVRSLKVKTSGLLEITKYAIIGSDTFTSDVNLEAKIISINSTITAKNINILTNEGDSNFNKNGQAFIADSINISSNNSYNEFGKIKGNLTLYNIYGEQIFSEIIGNVKIDNNSRKCDYNFNKKIEGNLIAGQKETETVKEVKLDSCNITYFNVTGQTDIHTTGEIIKKEL